MTDREQMLSDVITCAVEGGTGYWAQVERYKWQDVPTAYAVLRESPGDEAERQTELPIVLTTATVENAMFRIAHDPAFAVNSEIRKCVVYALATNDAGDIDADGADVIAQCIAFGDIVYG
jgi:hypothetical protein